MQVLDEVHLLNITVSPLHQSQGLGPCVAGQLWRTGAATPPKPSGCGWRCARATSARTPICMNATDLPQVGARKKYYPVHHGERETAILMSTAPMALNLDPRQRAMLQEMGITLWMPTAAVAPSPAAPGRSAKPWPLRPRRRPQPCGRSTPCPPHRPRPQPLPLPAVAAVTVAAGHPCGAPVTAAANEALPSAEWQICPRRRPTPPPRGQPARCLAGDLGSAQPQRTAGGRHGQAAEQHAARPVAAPQPPCLDCGCNALATRPCLLPGTCAPVAWRSCSQALAAHLQRAQPARVLVLGMHAARAVLGSEEALGRLRAQVHQVHGMSHRGQL